MSRLPVLPCQLRSTIFPNILRRACHCRANGAGYVMVRTCKCPVWTWLDYLSYVLVTCTQTTDFFQDCWSALVKEAGPCWRSVYFVGMESKKSFFFFLSQLKVLYFRLPSILAILGIILTYKATLRSVKKLWFFRCSSAVIDTEFQYPSRVSPQWSELLRPNSRLERSLSNELFSCSTTTLLKSLRRSKTLT